MIGLGIWFQQPLMPEMIYVNACIFVLKFAAMLHDLCNDLLVCTCVCVPWLIFYALQHNTILDKSPVASIALATTTRTLYMRMRRVIRTLRKQRFTQ